MSIKIERKTGWVGTFGNLQLLVNGKKNTKIRNNKSIEIIIPKEGATLQASTWGMKSNELLVQDGDQLLLKSTFWGSYGYAFMFFLIICAPYIQNIYISGFALAYAIIMFITVFIPGIHQKLERINAVEQ